MRGMAAELTVLHAGYATDEGVASTVVLIRDGESAVVVDPGMVRGPELILDPMASMGVAADDVTDVVLSHHHPDHTWHIALFPRARVHDVWAVYQGDQWDDQRDGTALEPGTTARPRPGADRAGSRPGVRAGRLDAALRAVRTTAGRTL